MSKKDLMTEYKIGEIISRKPLETVDFSKPILYNDDVFGRLYNQQDAVYIGTDQRVRHVMVAGHVHYCDEQGIEPGNSEPSVFNREEKQ